NKQNKGHRRYGSDSKYMSDSDDTDTKSSSEDTGKKASKQKVNRTNSNSPVTSPTKHDHAPFKQTGIKERKAKFKGQKLHISSGPPKIDYKRLQSPSSSSPERRYGDIDSPLSDATPKHIMVKSPLSMVPVIINDDNIQTNSSNSYGDDLNLQRTDVLNSAENHIKPVAPNSASESMEKTSPDSQPGLSVSCSVKRRGSTSSTSSIPESPLFNPRMMSLSPTTALNTSTPN
ncbi:unnamed protein product, partial [Owenia fusiformis]